MAVVKGVGMHLHQEGERVHLKEDLGGPGPIQHKRPQHPQCEPENFVDGLDANASSSPLEDARGAAAEPLDWQTEESTPNHGGVAEGEGEDISGEELVDLHSERIAGLLDIASCCRHHHDSQANPEEHEEAAEVAVLASGVKVRDARGVVDVVELLALRLGSGLLAGGRYGLGGGGSILGDGSTSSTVAT